MADHVALERDAPMKVVNVKVRHLRSGEDGPICDNLREWMAAPDHVYIGRRGVVFIDGKRFPPADSKWANPFKVQCHGTREEILRQYREYIRGKICEDPATYNLEELRGKVLGCWCKPEGCHGDVLVELLATRPRSKA